MSMCNINITARLLIVFTNCQEFSPFHELASLLFIQSAMFFIYSLTVPLLDLYHYSSESVFSCRCGIEGHHVWNMCIFRLGIEQRVTELQYYIETCSKCNILIGMSWKVVCSRDQHAATEVLITSQALTKLASSKRPRLLSCQNPVSSIHKGTHFIKSKYDIHTGP